MPAVAAEAAHRAGRLPQVDLLRAFAVALVIGRHASPPPSEYPAVLRVPLEAWGRCGWAGVDLFFVLSGFLVSGLLFQEYRRFGEVRPGRFLVRRGLKIYPAFYLLLLVTILAHASFSLRAPSTARTVSEALFVQNYGPRIWNHTWSLAVEEHFYLALALAVWLAVRRRRERPFDGLPFVVAGVVVVSLALRFAKSWGARYDFYGQLARTHLRMDALALGVLIAYMHHFRRETFLAAASRFRRLPLPAAALLCAPALALDIETSFMRTFGLTLLDVGCGLVLVDALLFREAAVSGNRALSALSRTGVYSYSIYLWHMPVRRCLDGVFGHASMSALPYWLDLIMFLVLAFAFGIVMSRLVETPVLALRDRFFPSRIRPSDAAA
jgi:peptidoglycan/LPS O-acetylase OafA/YrhL